MYQATAGQVSVDPIISRLRPRSIGEIIDQAFRLYRRNFLTFIAIIAVVVVPLQLAQQIISAIFLGNVESFATSPTSFTPGASQSSLDTTFSYLGIFEVATIGLALISALLQSLSQAALTAEVANSHLDKPVSFADGYKQMFSRLGSVLGVIFLELGIGIAIFVPIGLVFVLAIGAAIGSSFGSSSDAGSASGVLALFCFSCLLFIPAVALLAYVFTRLYVVTPAVMVEQLGPRQAIRRSWDLVKNYWWRTFGMLMLLALLASAVTAGPAFLIRSIVTVLVPRDFVLQTLLSGLVTVFTTVIYIPVQMVAVTLYYFDLRVRKEGFDLETAVAQRYFNPTMPMSPGVWAGAGYGQQVMPAPTMPPPNMPAPELGQGYGSYGQYAQNGPYAQAPSYGQGVPTLPTNTEGVSPPLEAESPRPEVDQPNVGSQGPITDKLGNQE